MYPYEIIGQQMNMLYKAGYDMAKNATNKTLEEVADKEAVKIKIDEDLDNLCGKPHNNGEESCLECGIIKENL